MISMMVKRPELRLFSLKLLELYFTLDKSAFAEICIYRPSLLEKMVGIF